MTSFNVIHEPWLDVVLSDGERGLLSLRDFLAQLHRIARLSESSPLTEVALLRFLIALVSDGLRELVSTEDDWKSFAARCHSGLPPEAIDAILEPLTGNPDVLADSHQAFFDGPAIRRVAGWDSPAARQPVSRFMPELPAGTNHAHFNHIDDGYAALCAGCLLKSRAVDAAFARGGLGPSLSRHLLATISGTEPRYVMLCADNLLHTILANLVVGDAGRPSWESIHKSKNGSPGPIARMSWRPRLMMPTLDSESQQPCVHCMTTSRPRFAQAVMVDTYNHKGSPYGSKANVEQWKASAVDPHLLAIEKNALSLGLMSAEWPLRAFTRMMQQDRNAASARMLERCASAGIPVAVHVTSGAGNRAKIDDAPAAEMRLPLGLLTQSVDDRTQVADGLNLIFHGDYRANRAELIPKEVPALLNRLADGDDPQQAVRAWLHLSRRKSSASVSIPASLGSQQRSGVTANGDGDPLSETGTRILRKLGRLSQQELTALRPVARGGAVAVAARQKAFEAVWHRVSLPPGSKRHAIRVAVVTVAGIYSAHSTWARSTHKRRQFEDFLKQSLRREFTREAGIAGNLTLHRLLRKIVQCSPHVRDELLLRLVDELVAQAAGSKRTIDFADLLIDVIRWNDRTDPTPARWRKLIDKAPAR